MTTPSPHAGNLVLVDDDADILKLLAIRLKSAGHRVNTATNALQALSMIAGERPDLVVTDLKDGGLDGMDLFHEIERKPGLPVIILTAHGSIPDAVAATREGVFGYLTKPYDPKRTHRANRARVGATRQRVAAHRQSWREEIITKSPLMEDLLKRAERVALAEAASSSKAKAAPARNCWRARSTKPARGAPAPSWVSTSARFPRPCWNRNSSVIEECFLPVPPPITRTISGSRHGNHAAR